MIRRPPISTLYSSSAASDVYKRQIIFFPFCLINKIFSVGSDNWSVCRNYNNIKFIDIPEFGSFRFSSTCHPGKLMVHPEIILKGNGGICLCSVFHLYIFFCLNCLMKSIGIAASFKNPTGLFIYNLYFIVHYNVLSVTVEKCPCCLLYTSP